MSTLRRAGWLMKLRCLANDQRGAVMLIVGLAIIPLFAVIGLAIDTGRGYMLKSKLSYAIDAAGLAGGRAFDTNLREQDIMMYFDANFPTGYMSSELLPGNPVVTIDDQQNTITIQASATMPTAFMGVVGVHEMTVSARTVIKRELRGMELALVMDNTGSMRGNGGMAAMKPAATELVNILFGDRETVPNFWVSIVPFVATVNIGPEHTDWLTGYDPDDFLPTEWKGCVEARSYPNDSNDAPPDVEFWRPFHWDTTLGMYWSDGSYGPHSPHSGAPYVLGGDNEWDPAGPESALKLDNDLYQNQGTGPNLGCGPAITPLTSSKTEVQAAIDEMAPWHRGGTLSSLGLAWGWRTLSPRWRGLWDTDDGLPLDYHTHNMFKVVILFTDGNNEWYDWPGPNDSECNHGTKPYGGVPGKNNYGGSNCTTYKNMFPDADYTAYGRLSQGRLGTTNFAAAQLVANDRMLDMCERMKAEGIIMYTLTFSSSVNSATRDLFSSCASDPSKYFNSPTGTDLHNAFVQIANELSSLRIAE